MNASDVVNSIEDAGVKLTAFEHSILTRLAEEPSRIVTAAELDSLIHGDRPAKSNVVQVIVSRLRGKMRDAGAPFRIEVQRRRGYRLAPVEPKP